MRFRKRKETGNKGFSLLEILVALAVSAVVITIVAAFISQGSKFYSEQGNSVNLQNELQEVSNAVNDALMQSTYLEIDESANSLNVYTGSYSYQGGYQTFDGDKHSARRICWDGSNIFLYDVADISLMNNQVKSGYSYSKYVSEISIAISDKCKNGNEGLYDQPIMLDVTITVSNKGVDRSETKTVSLRNKIDKLIFNGATYTRTGNYLKLVEDEEESKENV